MARARNIKPSIMCNDELAALPALDRLLFIYMWMLADREGRLVDKPNRIAAQALPYEKNADVEAMLDRLVAAGFIERYMNNGIGCIQIISFVKHQNPHIKEQASELPPRPSTEQAPEKHQTSTVHLPDMHGTSTEVARLIPSSLIPDSLNLIPDSTSLRSEGAAKPRTSRAKKDELTLRQYIDDCRAIGVKPIPDDHAVRTFAEDAGITTEMLQVAWAVFRETYLTTDERTKKYKSWPTTFHNSVKGNWQKIWFVEPTGEVKWSSVGLTHKTAIEARMAREAA